MSSVKMDSGGGGTGGSNLGEYDWSSEENAGKWRGLFVSPLHKVLNQVHPQFTAKEDALEYVENLLIKLLAMLTAKPVPVSVSDVEKRVSTTFPKPIDDWALTEAQRALEKGKRRASLALPFDKVHNLLKEVLHNNKPDDQVSLYLVAVLDYIAADILKLAGNYVKNMRHQVITCQDIKVAICADRVLMDLFNQDESNVINLDPDPSDYKHEQGYDEVVKEFIIAEKRYLRDIYMITKVFRDLLIKYHLATPLELEKIFNNINDVTELTSTLINSMEEQLEMTEQGKVSTVGTCFEELAEAEEFEVYDTYATRTLQPDCRKTLDELLLREGVDKTLITAGHGFKEAFKFYLPKLLLGPIYHWFHYFRYVQDLMKLTQSEEDRDSLNQVIAMITPLRSKLENKVERKHFNDIFYKSAMTKVNRQQSLQKLGQLQQSIEDFPKNGPDIASNSSELVYEGNLKVQHVNKKIWSERYVFLLDGMILVCKKQRKRQTLTGNAHANSEYSFREKFLIRKVDVIDAKEDESSPDQSELCFRIVKTENQTKSETIFKAESPEDKRSWMAALVMLNTKFVLERNLDVQLAAEEKKHPLRFPPRDKYRFAEANSSQNIVFEEREKTTGVPLIKGATLVKLVERLTHHVFADPMFMKTFLTTYRSFCSQNELLDMLIDRFNIPDPEFSSDSESDSEIGEKSTKMRIAQDMKRFKKEYSQPVQFRVLNVLKHWVDQHFYDFEQDTDLLHKLTSFLEEIRGKAMKKWVDCISKIVQRRLSHEELTKGVIFDKPPPEIEVHIVNAEESWPGLLTYHPIEIARQLTLLEFQYYRAVKTSELVDCAWTKNDKHERSPNLLKMSRHITNLTRYLEKLIVESENLEERICVIRRILEILVVLQELNNFSGVLALTSAFKSASIHRILFDKNTGIFNDKIKSKLSSNLIKAYDVASSLYLNRFKIYWEKLRSINPPCVPYFGQYQTNLLLTDEGNPDTLNNTKLINFAKRRKVADIISEIQQYQNQPYCLHECPEVREFLENLDPFPEWADKEIDDYLWEKSCEIEPSAIDRSVDAPVRRRADGERRWKGLDLTSPGIRPRSTKSTQRPYPLPKIMGVDCSPMTSPIFKSSPLLTPLTTPLTPNSTNIQASSPPSGTENNRIMETVNLPNTPHNTPLDPNIWPIQNTAVPEAPPKLPPKPKKEQNRRQPNTSPPPPLPPRQPRAPRTTPSRGALESRSPHMDPVDPRREHNLIQQQLNSHNPPPLVPRRHSNVVNGSGHRYPPPPLSLRTGSEGTSPSFSPDSHSHRPPPHSASARVHTSGHSYDLNNSLGTVSQKTPSSSNSGGGGGGGSHFTFNEAAPPPPRPPPHRPINSVNDAM